MDDKEYEEHNNKFQEWLPQKFREWVPGKKFPVNILILYKKGMYYSFATEYDLVTKGKTAEGSAKDLHKLVSMYLRAFFNAGQLYEKSLRPSPMILRLRFKIQHYMIRRGKFPSFLK